MVSSPTITFQAAIFLALGLNLDMIRPEDKIPMAVKTKATVPV